MPAPAARPPLQGWTLAWSIGPLGLLFELIGASVLIILGLYPFGGLVGLFIDPKPLRMLSQSWAQGDHVGAALQVLTFLFVGTFAVLFGGTMLRYGVGTVLDVLGTRRMVVGVAKLTTRVYKGNPYPVLTVGEEEFGVDKKMLRHITDRSQIRLEVGRFQRGIAHIWVEA